MRENRFANFMNSLCGNGQAASKKSESLIVDEGVSPRETSTDTVQSINNKDATSGASLQPQGGMAPVDTVMDEGGSEQSDHELYRETSADTVQSINNKDATSGASLQPQGGMAPVDTVMDEGGSEQSDHELYGSKIGKSFNSEFSLCKQIGKGSYSVVYLATRKNTEEVFACKVRIAVVAYR